MSACNRSVLLRFRHQIKHASLCYAHRVAQSHLAGISFSCMPRHVTVGGFEPNQWSSHCQSCVHAESRASEQQGQVSHHTTPPATHLLRVSTTNTLHMCLPCDAIYGVICSVCKLIFKIYTHTLYLYLQKKCMPPKSKLLLTTNLPPCAAGSPQGCPWKCIETFLYQSQGSNLCAMSGYCDTCTATFPFKI